VELSHYLAVLILIAEKLKRVFSTDGEITRKVVHIGTGNVILFAWWLNIPASVGISAAIIAAAIAILSYFLPILPSLNSVGRRSWGTFFYAVSIGVLVACFWPISHPEYAAMGILIMALGDGLAALVGQNFGTKFWSTSLQNFRQWQKSGRFPDYVRSQLSSQLDYFIFC